MATPKVMECDLVLPHRRPRSRLEQMAAPPEPTLYPSGRVPRVARLLALAHKFDQMIGQGSIADYACLAQVGHVSRARISQIINLLYLATDIQEQILFLPLTLRGRDPIHLRQLQSIALVPDWHRQRVLWRKLLAIGRQQPADKKPRYLGRNILEVPRQPR
jgi:hypothetical protein